MQELTKEIREQFNKFLDIHENLMVIDGRCPRSTKMDNLKTVLTKLAEPFRVSIHLLVLHENVVNYKKILLETTFI